MYSSETSFSVEELLGMILNNSRTIAEKFAGTDHKCFCLWLNIIFGLLRPFFSQLKCPCITWIMCTIFVYSSWTVSIVLCCRSTNQRRCYNCATILHSSRKTGNTKVSTYCCPWFLATCYLNFKPFLSDYAKHLACQIVKAWKLVYVTATNKCLLS